MRRSVPFLFTLVAAIVSLGSFAYAQVSTIPVGFNTAAIPAAVDANTPANVAISVPFYQPAVFVSAVSSVDSTNQLSVSGAAFTTTLTSPPYLARLKTGASVGRFFVVTANTATQLTLDTATAGYTLTTGAPSNTQAQVVAGDSVEILPANTFGTLFGTSTVPFQTGATANTSDNVYLFNGTTWEVYFHNGTNWKKSGNGLNQNNTVILPDRGLFVIRRATSPLNLTFLGTVPSTTEVTDFPGPGSTFRANRFPVDTTVLGLGLQTLPNWLSGATANTADDMYLWNGTSWSVYFYNGTNWKKSGNGLNQNGTVIPLGAAMFVVRQSSAAGSTSSLVQTLPYSL